MEKKKQNKTNRDRSKSGPLMLKKKTIFLNIQEITILSLFASFSVLENTPRDTLKTWKPLFTQLNTQVYFLKIKFLKKPHRAERGALSWQIYFFPR